MAQHGYLREFDEGRDRGDDRDRGDWRERSERDWRDRDPVWRGDRESHRDRGRGFMLGDDNRAYSRDRDEDRGFFSRIGDEARSWFRDDEREGSRDRGAWENTRDWPQRNRGSGGYGREHGFGGFQGDYRGSRQQGGFGGSNEWREEGRRFSANPDDHYRSWRDQQVQALDRDYQDYCREREQQFHRDFDSWRQNRQPRQGQGQQQGGGQRQDELMLSNRSETSGLAAGATNEPQAMSSPEGAATLGTNNSENSGAGRGRR
jgi:hypothetical protein